MKKLLIILFLLCGCLTIGGAYDNTTTDGFKEVFEQGKKEISNAKKAANTAQLDELDKALKKQAEEAGIDWEKLSDYAEAGVHLDNVIFINGWTKEKILAEIKELKLQGKILDPKKYLSAEYIANHLKEFDVGVTKFVANMPTGAVGPPSGTFVMPKNQADILIQQANGSIQKLENLLGLEKGTLGTNPIRIDIKNPKGLRMSNGSELGANEKWLPGGKTSGGILEATIDQVPIGGYTTTKIIN